MAAVHCICSKYSSNLSPNHYLPLLSNNRLPNNTPWHRVTSTTAFSWVFWSLIGWNASFLWPNCHENAGTTMPWRVFGLNFTTKIRTSCSSTIYFLARGCRVSAKPRSSWWKSTTCWKGCLSLICCKGFIRCCRTTRETTIKVAVIIKGGRGTEITRMYWAIATTRATATTITIWSTIAKTTTIAGAQRAIEEAENRS